MRSSIICFIALCQTVFPARAQEFAQYPGSSLDQTASQQASNANNECQVFLTSDSYDKVYSFYKKRYAQFVFMAPAPKLPSGKNIQWSFFLLDGARDLAHSTHWVKIQKPFVGSVSEDSTKDFEDIRDVTAVQEVRVNRPTNTQLRTYQRRSMQ